MGSMKYLRFISPPPFFYRITLTAQENGFEFGSLRHKSNTLQASVANLHAKVRRIVVNKVVIVNMSWRCAVYGCSNVRDPGTGISVHKSPRNKSDLDKWKRFVRLHRANFNPGAKFGICSKHFTQNCFVRTHHVEGHQRRLIKGSIPTIWGFEEQPNEATVSERSRRRVRSIIIYNNIGIS